MEKETQLLEINLISAQGLKTPSSNLLRRLQTYAVAWIEPSSKLKTQIDRDGGENPTWNEKFIFRSVTSDFLSGETSGINIKIYAKSYIKDPLLGTVRFLISNNCIRSNGGGGSRPATTPALTAVQIRRRPSGRFQGVLNIAATVLNGGLELAAIDGLQAICFRDLIDRSWPDHRRKRSNMSEKSSDGAESPASSSSNAATTVLKDLTNHEIGEELAAPAVIVKKESLSLHRLQLHSGR